MFKKIYIHLDCNTNVSIVDTRHIDISNVKKSKCWKCKQALENIKEVKNG